VGWYVYAVYYRMGIADWVVSYLPKTALAVLSLLSPMDATIRWMCCPHTHAI